MDRGERRHRTERLKARRLRYFYEYGGQQRGYIAPPWPGPSDFHYYAESWLNTPWKVIPKGWFMHEAPSAWINSMMTRPARRAQRAAARAIERGVDPDVIAADWPDYRRPYIYYW